jgi:hypothetical protein
MIRALDYRPGHRIGIFAMGSGGQRTPAWTWLICSTSMLIIKLRERERERVRPVVASDKHEKS